MTVPAIRYPQFVDAFGVIVAEAQAKIRAIERQQRPYIAVTRALAALNLPHDLAITMQGDGVSIFGMLLPADTWADVERILAEIGAALVDAKLRDHPNCTLNRRHEQYVMLSARWGCKVDDTLSVVRLNLIGTVEGTAGIGVKNTPEMTTVDVFEVFDRGPQAYHPAPEAINPAEVEF
jgi:hypothetical protein